MNLSKHTTLGEIFRLTEEKTKNFPNKIKESIEELKWEYNQLDEEEIQRLDIYSSVYAKFLHELDCLYSRQRIPFIYLNLPKDIRDDIDALTIINENRVNLITTKHIQENYPGIWSFLISLGTSNVIISGWNRIYKKTIMWRSVTYFSITVFGEIDKKLADLFKITKSFEFDNIKFAFKHYDVDLPRNLNRKEVILYLHKTHNVVSESFLPFHNMFYKLYTQAAKLCEKQGIELKSTGSEIKSEDIIIPRYKVNQYKPSKTELIEFFSSILMDNRMNTTKTTDFSVWGDNFYFQISKAIESKRYMNKTLLEILCTNYSK